jgi:subtilase family serine protease
VVAFYDGNPTNSGVLITNITIPGWLEGAGTNTVGARWVVPEPATSHVLFAAVDPSGAVAEFEETNNSQSLCIGSTDLAVYFISQSPETNGAVRVIARVHNLGAPTATNSVLAIRRAGSPDTPLATAPVPMLEPGRFAEVALDLPAGTQTEGETIYTLRADDTAVISDVDTNNNTASFAVNLRIDSDGDELPDSYEARYAFLNATSAADAGLDYDGDGLSNLAEYRAGTDPQDRGSYLKIDSLLRDSRHVVQITWGSTSNRVYSIQRSSAMNPGSSFTNIAESILSTPPENVFVDITATNGPAHFYRLKLQ